MTNFNDPHNFDEEILEIERDLYKFFVNGLVSYSSRDPIYAKIISCFFTRQELTQSQLMELTNLSRGAISETLQKFLELNIIEKSSHGGKFHYKMDGISFGKSEYLMNIEGKYAKMIEELHRINEDLVNNEEKFEKLDGYLQTKELNLQILEVLENVIPSLNAFEQALAQMIKKDRNR